MSAWLVGEEGYLPEGRNRNEGSVMENKLPCLRDSKSDHIETQRRIKEKVGSR